MCSKSCLNVLNSILLGSLNCEWVSLDPKSPNPGPHWPSEISKEKKSKGNTLFQQYQVKIHVSKQHYADRTRHLQRHWLLRVFLQIHAVIPWLGKTVSPLPPFFFLLIMVESNTAMTVKCTVRSPYAQMFAVIQGCKWCCTWGSAHCFLSATCLQGCRQGFDSNK